MTSYLRIGLQTAFSAGDALDPYRYAVDHAFDAFDWFADRRGGAGWGFEDLSQGERRRVREQATESGMVYTVHAPWQCTPLSAEGQTRILESIAFARDIGADLVNFHFALEQGIEAFVDRVMDMQRHAAAAGVRLALENTPLTTPPLCNQVFDAIGRRGASPDQVGLCLDVGHANLCAGTRNDYIRFIDGLDPDLPITHVHLHENYGDEDSHLVVFTGPAQYNDAGIRLLLSRLRLRAFQGVIILEQWPDTPSQLLEARARLNQLASWETSPAQAADAPELAAQIAKLAEEHTSRRRRLEWVRDTLHAADVDLSLDRLVDLAVFLRFVGSGALPCAPEPGRRRPGRVAHVARDIEQALLGNQTPGARPLIRSMLRWLPSDDTALGASDPVARIAADLGALDLGRYPALAAAVKELLQHRQRRGDSDLTLDRQLELLLDIRGALQFAFVAVGDVQAHRMRLADVTLEDLTFVLLRTRIDQLEAGGSALPWQSVLANLVVAVRNVSLGGVLQAECGAVARALELWGESFDPHDRDRLLALASSLDRARRLAARFSKQVLAPLPSRVERLGGLLGVDSTQIRDFCADDLERSVAFQVSRLATLALAQARALLGDAPEIEPAEAAGAGATEAARARVGTPVPPVVVAADWSVVRLAEADFARCGAKAANCSRLLDISRSPDAQFDVPAGCVLPFGTMELCLARDGELQREYTERRRQVAQASAEQLDARLAELREVIGRIEIAEHLLVAILGELEQDSLLFVRSSCNAEDPHQCASAGLGDCVAGVTASTLPSAIITMWSTLWTPRAVLCRRAAGAPDQDVHVAVLVQPAVPAELSFILHTEDPRQSDPGQASAELAVGLGQTLAASAANGTPYRVVFDRSGERSHWTAFASFDEALGVEADGALRRWTVDYTGAALTTDRAARDAAVARLRHVASFVQDAFGAPQQVEGTMAGDTVYVVQTRPEPQPDERERA